MEGVCRLKIGGARPPTDILECALEYKKVGNPWFKTKETLIPQEDFYPALENTVNLDQQDEKC